MKKNSTKPTAPALDKYQRFADRVARTMTALQGMTSTEAECAINALLPKGSHAKWSSLARPDLASALVVADLLTDPMLEALKTAPRTMLVADRQPRPLPGQEVQIQWSQRRWFVAEQSLQRGIHLKQGDLKQVHSRLHPVDVPRTELLQATFRHDGALKVSRANLLVVVLPMVYRVRLISGPTPGPWEFAIDRPDGVVDRNISWPSDVELNASILTNEVLEKCSAPDRVSADNIVLSEELLELFPKEAP